jgi:hypothetical protein
MSTTPKCARCGHYHGWSLDGKRVSQKCQRSMCSCVHFDEPIAPTIEAAPPRIRATHDKETGVVSFERIAAPSPVVAQTTPLLCECGHREAAHTTISGLEGRHVCIAPMCTCLNFAPATPPAAAPSEATSELEVRMQKMWKLVALREAANRERGADDGLVPVSGSALRLLLELVTAELTRLRAVEAAARLVVEYADSMECQTVAAGDALSGLEDAYRAVLLQPSPETKT